MSTSSWRIVGLLLASMGCGDALVGDDYRGESVLTLEGSANPVDPYTRFDRQDLNLSLFWDPRGLGAESPDRLEEQRGASMELRTIPQAFTYSLYNPPEGRLMALSRRGVGHEPWAMGRLFTYADLDQDHAHDPDEPWFGGIGPRGVLYAREDIPAEASPTRRALPAGFHVILLPMPCELPWPEPNDEGDCGVPLGAACETDAECGAGICLKELHGPWVGGYCALPEPNDRGCTPAAAGYFPWSARAELGGYFLAPCAVDADCARPPEYVCDVAAGACVPDAPLLIRLSSTDDTLEPACRSSW